jgi:hypothetical protein
VYHKLYYSGEHVTALGTKEDPAVERKIACGHMHKYPVVGRDSYIASRGYGMRNGK